MTIDEFQALNKKVAKTFLQDHIELNSKEFALKFHNRTDLPIRALAEQLHCLDKVKTKIPSFYNTYLVFTQRAIEQCSSEATAKYKQAIINGNSLLDMNCGLGIDSYFLSHSFNSIDSLENNELLFAIVKSNFEKLNCQKVNLINKDSVEFLQNTTNHYDWIYLDPDRRQGNHQRSISFADHSPNILELEPLLLEKGSNVLIKCSPFVDISYILNSLKSLNKICVISVENECKEVLLILSKEKTKDIILESVVLDALGNVFYKSSKKLHEEFERVTAPKVLNYFYEPDKALIKGRLTDKLAYDLQIVFVNDQVDYLSSQNHIENFPGRKFKVLEVLPYNKKTVQNYLLIQQIHHANIARRHFPDTPEYIKKLLKLKDGGSTYLFFTRNFYDELICIVCEKT